MLRGQPAGVTTVDGVLEWTSGAPYVPSWLRRREVDGRSGWSEESSGDLGRCSDCC